jgi:hypothetical protein
LAKILDVDHDSAVAAAKALAEELLPLLASTWTGYNWSPLHDATSFNSVWQPFDWDTAYIGEIRRREDLVPIATMRPRPVLGYADEDQSAPFDGEEKTSAYFVSPLLPRAGSMSRLLRLICLRREPLMFQAAIAPIALTDMERAGLARASAACEKILRSGANGSDDAGSSFGPLREASMWNANAVGTVLMNQFHRLAASPSLLTLSVAGTTPLPRTLLEAIGVELFQSSSGDGSYVQISGDLLRGGFDIVEPRDTEDRQAARANAQHLRFTAWGPTLAPPELRRVRFMVEATEAAAAFRLPIVTDAVPGLSVRHFRLNEYPIEAMAPAAAPIGDKGTSLGRGVSLGRDVQISLASRDRAQHVYIAGQTGTGKTTLMKTMILSDIADGRGVGVIDPHGDLFEDLLALIPPHRINDVIVLDPNDVDYPIGLNLLDIDAGGDAWSVVREMRAIAERLLVDQFGTQSHSYTGPMFYMHMQMNMLLAMSDPNDPGTLLEFFEIFSTKDYWRRWLPLESRDSRLVRWVEDILPKTDYARRGSEGLSMGEYFSSKFMDFVADPKLRLIFGQKRSTIDIDAAMNDGKILLVNLAKGQITEANARFLGMVLMAKIQAAAMRRVGVAAESRRPFYLYVDEFQSLATENFSLLLSEARKFGVSLVLANQFVSQVRDERLTQSIFGNVGTLISFRLSRDDATTLAPYYEPSFDAADLTGLPNRMASVRTVNGGQMIPPFSLWTCPAELAPDPQVRRQVRLRSRTDFGRPRAEVEKIIERSLSQRREDADAASHLKPTIAAASTSGSGSDQNHQRRSISGEITSTAVSIQASSRR